MSNDNEDLGRMAEGLVMLEELGGGGADIAEAFGIIKLDAETRRWVFGPIVAHDAGGWWRDLPKDVFAAVRAERLEIALGKHPRWIVGPCEITVVMYDRSMAAPMHYRGGTDLYLWAVSQAVARIRKKPLAEVWRMLDPRGRLEVSDDDILDRHGPLHDHYRRLCDEIRSKVGKHSKVSGASPKTPWDIKEALPVAMAAE